MPDILRFSDIQIKRPYLSAPIGQLTISGARARDLVAEYGSPLFVFSAARLRENCAQLLDVFAHPTINTRIHYAAKANNNLAILSAVQRAGLHVEVNSGGELYKALRAGFAPEQVIFNGVAKRSDEITFALQSRIFCLNIDSLFELQRVIAVARQLKRRARIALRVVPEIGGDHWQGLATGTAKTKFGIALDEFDATLELVAGAGDVLEWLGMHLHIGAQTDDAAKYDAALRVLLELTARAESKLTARATLINIGGGLPVDYLPPPVMVAAQSQTVMTSRTPLHVFAQTLFESLAAHPNPPALVLEPGSRVIADAGVLLATVENVKRRAALDENWLLLDAGFNTLLDTLAYSWYFHGIAADRADAPHDHPYRLGGPLCDGADVYHDAEDMGRLPDHRYLPAGMQSGDVIAFLDAGGYTVDQMHQYNGQPRAAAVMVMEDGSVALIRRRETYDDLTAFDLPLP